MPETVIIEGDGAPVTPEPAAPADQAAIIARLLELNERLVTEVAENKAAMLIVAERMSSLEAKAHEAAASANLAEIAASHAEGAATVAAVAAEAAAVAAEEEAEEEEEEEEEEGEGEPVAEITITDDIPANPEAEIVEEPVPEIRNTESKRKRYFIG